MGEIAVGIGLGITIGLTLSILGAGGSILTVPTLVYIADLSAQEATGTALLVVAGAAAVGAAFHYAANRVQVRTALALGGAGIGGAFAGAWLNGLASERVILILLSILMLVAALRMLPGLGSKMAVPRTGSRTGLTVVSGGALGLLTGFFGVGGGFLIVPVLVLVLLLPISLAVGTSLLVIVINSVSGLVAHLSFGSVDFETAIPFMIGAGLGAVLGTRVAGRLSPKVHRTGFATLLVVVAVLVFVQNIV